MTQYYDSVERHRLLLEAEDWSMKTKSIHVHSFSSMWYDDHPEDTADGNVTDIEYNCGYIVRKKNGKVIRTFGEILKGDALLDSYVRNS